MDIRETFEFVVTPPRAYIRTRVHSRALRVERAYFYTLKRDPDGRGGGKARTAVGDGILIREKIPPLVTEAGWAQ